MFHRNIVSMQINIEQKITKREEEFARFNLVCYCPIQTREDKQNLK